MNTPSPRFVRPAALLSCLPLLTTVAVTALAALPVAAAHAQKAESAPSSALAAAPLPAGAVRVPPAEVPEQVTKLLRQMVQAAGSKVRQGRSEVLAWTADGGEKMDPARIKMRLSAAMRDAGWDYEEYPAEDGTPFTVAGARRTEPSRRALVAVWLPTDDALVLAWTEVLPKDAPGPITPPPPSGGPAGEKQEGRSLAGILDGLKSPYVVTPPVPEQYRPPAEKPAPAAGIHAAGDAIVVGPRQVSVNVMKGEKAPRLPAFPAVPVKKGFVRGYVKGMDGKPLAGAVLGVRSSATGGYYSGAQGKTDAKGYYEIAVPWGAAEFYTASVTLNYSDGRAAFGLHPADGEASPFASVTGSVENFVLLSQGVADRDRASDDPKYAGNYYGGTFTVNYSVADPRFRVEGNLPGGSDLEVTLTPTGRLLGGGAGRPIVLRRAVREDGPGQFYVNNVPVGTYRLQARLLRGGGAATPLKLKEAGPGSGNPFGLEPKEGATEATLTFRPGSAKAGTAPAGHGNWAPLAVTVSL